MRKDPIGFIIGKEGASVMTLLAMLPNGVTQFAANFENGAWKISYVKPKHAA